MVPIKFWKRKKFMLKFGLSLLIGFGLMAAPQAVKKTEEAVQKTAKKAAAVTEAAAKDVAEGTKKVAKKTAKVAKTVATETVDATKTGTKKVVAAVEPKKKTTAPVGGKVNLNTATRAELIALPGIGEANADKIIKARPIASVEDLSAKKIIQNQYYEKVKGLVSVK